MNSPSIRYTARSHFIFIALTLALAACAPAAAPPPTAAPTTAAPAAEKAPPAAPAAQPTAPPAAKPAAKASGKEELEQYFRGKTVTLTVGYAPGGGFDTIARIFAEFAPRHIPGNPQFAVTNLPGADSMIAAKKVQRDKPDGLSWVVFIDGLVKRAVLGNEEFDPLQMTYLGTTDNSPAETFFMVRSSVATSLKDVMESKRPLKIADARGGSGAQAEFARILGLPLEPVYGYGGTSEYFSALERGEVDGSFRGDPAIIRRLYPHWIEQKFITPILFFEEPCCADFIAQGGWQTPPQLTKAVSLTDTQRRAFEAHSAIRATRIFALPPGMPDNLRIGLEQAFADTLKDPEFVAVMNERVNTQVGLGTGESILSAVKNLTQQPPEVLDILRTMYAIGTQ